jgi:hypothetical protein
MLQHIYPKKETILSFWSHRSRTATFRIFKPVPSFSEKINKKNNNTKTLETFV